MVKAARVPKPGQIEIVERQPEPLGAGEVRLRIEAAGICGSDVALLAGKHPYAIYPVIPGHELGGAVLEAAPEVEFAPGQRVAVCPMLTCGRCRACLDGRPNHCPEVRVIGVHLDGGLAEELVLPAALLRPVPDHVAAEAAAMVEPTAVALHACRRARVAAGTSLAIIGTGVIGLLILQVARAWGAGPVLAVDRVPERLALAETLGAAVTVDNRSENMIEAGRSLCPDGFDVVVDLVGRGETLSAAVALARRGGVIVPVALPYRPVTFDFEPLYRKELTLCGTRLYAADFDEAIALLASGQVEPRLLISHRFPLAGAAQAFQLAVERPEQAVKIVINP